MSRCVLNTCGRWLRNAGYIVFPTVTGTSIARTMSQVTKGIASPLRPVLGAQIRR